MRCLREMMFRLRMNAAGVIAPLLAVPAFGQPPAAADWAKARAEMVDAAQQELRSGVARTTAWGAFRAGEYRLTECTADLAAVLESPPKAEPLEQSSMLSAVLDAAVRLRADITPTILRRYWTQRPVHAAILFSYAKSPDRDPVLLEILRSATGFSWHAAANMLQQSRAPGLAAFLLSDLQLVLSVTVFD